jgi:hypothetical protein
MSKDKHGKGIKVGDWVRRADGTVFQVRGITEGKNSAPASSVEVCDPPDASSGASKASEPGDGTIVWD